LNKSVEEISRENKELAKAIIKERGGILDDQLLSCR
jgi:L-aspartate oxidase